MSDYFAQRDIKNIEQIGNYVENYLPEICYKFFISKEANTSSNTRLGWAIDLSVFFEFIGKYKFGNLTAKDVDLERIKQITTMDITSFLSYLSYYEHNGQVYQNGNAGKSRKLASVRTLFKWLFNNNYILSDVSARVETPKRYEKAIIRLEIDEVAKILNTSENPMNSMTKRQAKYLQNTSIRDCAILTLFLSTGIRVSECVGLNIKDFDFENNAFKITRKGGNQTILYFGDEAKEALLKWLEIRSLMALSPDEQAMFTSLQKKRITVRAVQYLVKKYAKCVNPLKKISPHKLRSTFGTNLYRSTHDIYMVADVLGHKDINTTQKHYAAVAEDSRKTAASVVKLRDKKD